MRATGGWMSDEGSRDLSSGHVETPESWNLGACEPCRRGLCCPEIFGLVAWPKGAGTLRAIAGDRRDDRWGHIDLPISVPRQEGPARALVLVLPPAYRPYRLLSADENRRRLRRRAERLIAMDAAGEWPYGDPLDKILEEEGLDGPDALERVGEGLEPHRLLDCYRAVRNTATYAARVRELRGPPEVVTRMTANLVDACQRLDLEIRGAGLPEAVRQRALGRTR